MRGRLVSVLAAIALIGVSVAIDATVWFAPLIVFVLVVPFEKLFPRHRGQRVRRPEVTTDLTYALASPLLDVVGLAVGLIVGVVSLAWLPGLLLRPLVAEIPAALLPIVGLVLFDLALYWMHRWSHEVPVLWRFHAVHHSTETLDWISGFRVHPFDGVIIAPPVVFLLAAGFDAAVAGALAFVQIVVGIFLHANVNWRLRPLQRVVATPEFHHWHHANEADAINTNYAGLLPIWDVVFGSLYLPRNKRPLVYGISEDMPGTVVGQLGHPMRGGGRLIRQAVRHPGRGVRRLAAFVRDLHAAVWASTTRPRRRPPSPGEPCRWATTAPTPAVSGQSTKRMPSTSAPGIVVLDVDRSR